MASNVSSFYGCSRDFVDNTNLKDSVYDGWLIPQYFIQGAKKEIAHVISNNIVQYQLYNFRFFTLYDFLREKYMFKMRDPIWSCRF